LPDLGQVLRSSAVETGSIMGCSDDGSTADGGNMDCRDKPTAVRFRFESLAIRVDAGMDPRNKSVDDNLASGWRPATTSRSLVTLALVARVHVNAMTAL
jgi:hypothetical protein